MFRNGVSKSWLFLTCSLMLTCGLFTTAVEAEDVAENNAVPAIEQVPQTGTSAIDRKDVVTPDKPAEAAKEAPEAVSEEKLAELIKQLDADKFAQRRAASKQLQEIGQPAIPAIAKATQSSSLEVKSRAFDLLESFFEEGDEATKAAAKKALEKLAEGKNDVAARAKGILTPMDQVASTPQPQQPIRGIQIPRGRIQIQGGNIQRAIQIQAAGGRGMKLKIANNNGNKQIEAEENGVKVKINEDAAGKIKMEVTKKKGEKEETKKYEAKNAADLKKNHPEAHKLYEKYSVNNKVKFNAGQIQIFQGGQLPILPPGGVRRPPGIPAPVLPVLPQFGPNQQGNLPPNVQQKQIEMAKQLKEALERLQANQQQKLGNAAPKRLDDQIKQIDEQIKRLEAQLKVVDPLPEDAEIKDAAEDAPAEEQAQDAEKEEAEAAPAE